MIMDKGGRKAAIRGTVSGMICGTGLTMAVAVSGGAAAAQGVELPPISGDGPMLCPDLGQGAWLGGGREGSDVASLDGTLDQSGVTIVASGNAIHYFTVSSEAEIRLEAQPQFGGDTVLELYDASGNFVLTDDDGGGGLASRAETSLLAGEYCLLTRGFGGGAVVADIRVARSEFDAITEGFSFEDLGGGGTGFYGQPEACTASTEAVSLGQGAVDAALEAGLSQTASAAQTPYYRFTLASPQALVIRAENEFADPVIYLYDNAGQLIAENDDYRSLNAQLDFTTPLAAGTYCVAMEALSDQTAPITVSLSAYDAAQAMYQMYADGEVSPPLGSDYPVTDLGELRTRLVMDQQVGDEAVYYRFAVPEGGLALIDAIEITDADPVLRLFDGLGREIAYNDDANGTFDSQIVSRIEPGEYMIGVTQFSSGRQGVIRVSIERFVPAQ